jgi:hypothetical protein
MFAIIDRFESVAITRESDRGRVTAAVELASSVI